MNSRQRVLNRLNGQPVDRIPNMNIIMQYAARKIGVPYSEYVQDYRRLVEGNVACCREYGIDLISTISDAVRETHDMGAEVHFPYDGVPHCPQPLVKELTDLDKVRIVDPWEGTRMGDRLQAVQAYKESVGDEFAILGWVEGVFAEAADLRGINSLMMDVLLEPAFCMDLMETVYIQQEKFVRAQVAAGADIIGVGDAAASLIGPELYRQFALPFEYKLRDVIHEAGAKMKLHICGNINALLDDIHDLEPDVLDIDYYVDYKDAIERFKDTRISIAGNLDPVTEIQDATPNAIIEQIHGLLAHDDGKCIIAGGCEIPVDTPHANLLAMTEALGSYQP